MPDPEPLPDREHIVQLNAQQRLALKEFAADPNGGLRLGRLTVEACGTGLLIRTDPYRAPERLPLVSGIFPRRRGSW